MTDPAPAPGGSVAAGVVLYLLVAAGSLGLQHLGAAPPPPPSRNPPAAEDFALGSTVRNEPVRALELILPGIWRPVSPATADANTAGLAARALWHPHARPRGLLYVGIIPLLLGLLAAFSPSQRDTTRLRSARWIGRLFLLAWIGVAVFDPSRLTNFQLLGSVGAALGLLAAVGLVQLDRQWDDVAPAMALAIGALILTCGLILLALASGSGTPAESLRPLLERLDEPTRQAYTAAPAALAANATALGSTYDAAALTAFGSLVVLLWFLKRRDRLATAVLILAVVADLGAHAWWLAR